MQYSFFDYLMEPAQICGWLGLVFYVISFQILTPRKTIMLWIPAHLLYGLHYLLLGSIPAASMGIISSIRDSFGAFAPKKYFHPVLIICFISAWAVTFLTFHFPYEFLPALANTFMTIATFFRQKFWLHRAFSYCHQLTFLSFGLFILSYPLITLTIMLIISNTIGIYRYRKK